MTYDRGLLLGAKRDVVLRLWEVRRYGLDSYGDPDYVCLYGMRPTQWYSRGLRIAGRTAVECTRDALAERIAQDVGAVAVEAGTDRPPIVIDPFAGSANTLYWIVRNLPGSLGIGFEIDDQVHALTHVNLALMSAPIDYSHIDYADGLARLDLPSDRLVICFLAPPWGDALDPHRGLDLVRTVPPVADVIDAVTEPFFGVRVLFAVQIHENTTAASLAGLHARFDWAARRTYHLTAAGTNHGVLLGTRHWKPPESM